MNSTTLHFIRRWLGPACSLAVAALGAVPASAATGDLVVVCYNADGNDDFALIALANIPGGTRYFRARPRARKGLSLLVTTAIGRFRNCSDF